MKKKVEKFENDAIDTTEMLEALEELEKNNGIKKEVLQKSIEEAIVIAYKRNFECQDENVRVVLDSEDGKMHIYQEKEVVKEVENDKTQISLKDAKEIKKDYKAGDTVLIELLPKKFGRIAAQSARQVITQKIREISREVIFNDFSEKKGEIVTGLIQKADGGAIVLDLGRIEGIMPKKEQVSTESYQVNDKIKACIISVEKGVKGSTQIILSRASTEFVRKLFEIEIPEIYEGVIEIKSISRDAGSRSKVAVYSPNPNIDPVGSCVGQKGIRIQNIINELNGEKIDVIEWNEDPAIYISTALLPAKVLAVDVNDKFAQVIVPDDQLSLAIGKAGQNARLAAKLTDYKIDIKSESQFREMLIKAQEEAEAGEVEENAAATEIDEEAILKAEELIQEQDEELKEEKTKRGRKNKEESEEKAEEVVEEAPKKRGRPKKVVEE